MIKAHGKTYESLTEAQGAWDALEVDNLAHGYSDGRVTEQNAIREAMDASLTGTPPAKPEPTVSKADHGYVVDSNRWGTWVVVRGDFEMPCDHPACATMHRHLHNVRYDQPEVEWVENIRTGEQKQVTVRTGHSKTVRQWVILFNGERVGEAHDTKREAVAEVKRIHPTI